jgi:hypothetical protein
LSGQQPGGNCGSTFELASLTPHIEENLADEILRNLLVTYEPKPEPEHLYMVPSVQHLHREAVALSDPGDQDIVRSRLCSTQWPSRNVGRLGSAAGSMARARFFRSRQRPDWICDEGGGIGFTPAMQRSRENNSERWVS